MEVSFGKLPLRWRLNVIALAVDHFDEPLQLSLQSVIPVVKVLLYVARASVH